MKEILCTYSTSVLIIILKFNKSEKEALLSKERERERTVRLSRVVSS